MACSCHLPLQGAGGIVDSDEQYGSTNPQPVSHRSEYLGPVGTGLCSVCNYICSWSFFFPCSCPSLTEQCLLVLTPQYQSINHNIFSACELLVHFVYMLHLMLQKDAVWSIATKPLMCIMQSFSYGGEVEVNWESRVIPKQKVVWAITCDSGPHSIISLD